MKVRALPEFIKLIKDSKSISTQKGFAFSNQSTREQEMGNPCQELKGAIVWCTEGNRGAQC